MPFNLDYYYGNEAEQCSFYRIPKILFTDNRYSAVSLEAKVLYSLLLDRMSLSAKNGWVDDNKVFIYFTLEDVQAHLCCGHNKAVALLSELDKLGLIERKKQGQGKPTKIYVKTFAGEEAKASQKGKSAPPEKGSQDFPKRDANKTEKNKTEQNDTDLSIPPQPPAPPVSPPAGRTKRRMDMDKMDSYRALIKDNIGYDLLLQEHPYDEETLEGYLELLVETCSSQKDFIRISGEEIPTNVVRGRFLKLTREHIAYVLESLSQNTTLVKNIKAYTLAALYNAPVTISQYYASLVSHDMAHGFESG